MNNPMTTYDNGDFTNDDTEAVGRGAIKYDGGKPSVYRGVVDYFPRAVMAVAAISTFGANKYAWKGWEGVEDGIARYSDAMMRHLLQEATGEELDPDSGMMHAAHAAWGALARLELILREQQDDGDVYDLPEDMIINIDDELTDEELALWFNKLMSGQNNA